MYHATMIEVNHNNKRDSMTEHQLPGDTFAVRLRQERERQGVSQTELARRISERLDHKIEPSAISRIEQSMRAVRLDEAVAAAEVLRVSLVDLTYKDTQGHYDKHIRQALEQLATAEHQWEIYRTEVTRLRRVVHHLVEEQKKLTARPRTPHPDIDA